MIAPALVMVVIGEKGGARVIANGWIMSVSQRNQVRKVYC